MEGVVAPFCGEGHGCEDAVGGEVEHGEDNLGCVCYDGVGEEGRGPGVSAD